MPARWTVRLMLLPSYTVFARYALTPPTFVSKLSQVTGLPASSIRQAVYSGWLRKLRAISPSCSEERRL